MAIKFPLKMRGVDVRNLEDLRKNFELNAAIEYFKNGKLIQWLKARYHDKEVDKISALDENAPDFHEKLCAALGVTFDNKLFRNDDGIIYEMFQWDEDDNIISPPSTSTATVITANEKEYTPVNQSEPTVSDEMREMFETIFGKREIWEVINRDGKIVINSKSDGGKDNDTSQKGKVSLIREDYIPKTLTPVQKKMFLKMVCDNKYTEDDLIFIRVVDDFSSGFAFTKDSFCYGGDLLKNFEGEGIILYREINSVEFSRSKEKVSGGLTINDDLEFNCFDMECHYQTKIFNASLLWQMGTFLDFVKG
ncbi:MAG: hypothetical protein IKZ53_00700 [Selenomonadaceae bacterium]|nr:hypothetical protein [Selenomonadaceae bacterium]